MNPSTKATWEKLAKLRMIKKQVEVVFEDRTKLNGSFFHIEVGMRDCFVADAFVRLIHSVATGKEAGSP
jgi:hypothetical protein